ncbi:dUTP diphosphatase [Psittacicella gerlachiana]|uniref:Deoxyuridine 5'-triphosphate nucleotidohydrolase n=1 Tax=Psittacicella gerlachiana TaxID=2028574 RepID=A0A3A1YLJ0_9GAMM|nr:dUTP diphosphatase [Psittacicella gerlachiana]RIY37104.1 deoxyuridine 5'-triphosphate nucleotidohydrolase [Psittacicella gerlachiana]
MNKKLDISYKILDKEFFAEFGLPNYGSEGAAGIDLRANLENKSSLTIEANQTVLINTGIAIFIDNPNYAAFIYPRSGQGHKRGLVLGNLVGVVDSDYQGEIKVSLWNRSNQPQTIEHGERIAQLVFQLITQVQLHQVEEFSSSQRGENGFGSTGIK